MIALYILGGLSLLILLVLILPVRLRVTYDKTLTARLRILFFIPYTLYDESRPEKPAKKKKADADKPKKEKPKKEKKSASHLFKERAEQLKTRGAAGVLDWLRDMARLVLGATRRLLRAIRVTRLDLQIRVAGEDAAETALSCGRWCAAAYPLLGTLMCAVRTKRSDVRIEPDYFGDKTIATADVRLSILPWRVLVAAVWMLISYLRLTRPGSDQTVDRREQKIKRAAEKKIKELEKKKQQKEAS